MKYIIFFSLMVAAMAHASDPDIISRFDHEFHDQKVLKPNNVDCSHCHNFDVDKATGIATPTADLKTSTFKRLPREICHECHRGNKAEYAAAPKACFTCHRSMQSMGAIKPKNHSNIAWKQYHATNARVDGDSCLNCHMTSQCVKCHQRRNDIELQNHSRNFKFFHSVQARAQPHRCDSCHSKSFCVNCHLGK